MKIILSFILITFTISASAQSISRDSLGRVKKVLYPDSSYITYTYDNNGNRTSQMIYIPAPKMEVSPSKLTFGIPSSTCKIDTVKNLVIKNVGDADLIVTALTSLDSTFVFTHTLPDTISRGDSVAISITVKRGDDTTTIFTDTLFISNNDKNTSIIIQSIPPRPLKSKTVSTNITCFGIKNGSIDLTVSGGSSPYKFTWSRGDTTKNISNLDTGKYVVAITDSMNCKINDSTVITQPPKLIVSDTTKNILCFGDSTGEIHLTASGGTPPYSYSWSTKDSTKDIHNLLAGTYIGKVRDSLNCPVSDTVLITQLAKMNIYFTVNNASCKDSVNGSIHSTVSKGIKPYRYLWDRGDTVADISKLASGKYSLTITDSNNCTVHDTATVIQPQALIAEAGKDTLFCFKPGKNITIGGMPAASGGSPPYTYSWTSSFPFYINNPTLPNPMAYPNSSTLYHLKVTDEHGCLASDSIRISVNLPDTARIVITAKSTKICQNDLAVFTASATKGGTNPVFDWEINYISTGIHDSVFKTTDLKNNYVVTCTMRSSLNCVLNSPASSNYILMTVYPRPSKVTITPNGLEICEGSTDSLKANPNYLYYHYQWSDGHTTPHIPVEKAGIYSVIATNINGCPDTASVEVKVNPLPNVNAGTDTMIISGNSINLSATGANTYLWTPSNGLNNNTIANPIANPKATITYIVTGTDINKCSNKDTLTITIITDEKCEEVYIPNAFSPNGNKFNDAFKVRMLKECIKEINFAIYDRWGKKVFETSDIKEAIETGWNGTYNGKELNTAVFVYSVKVILFNDKEITKQGNISLIR